MWSHSPVRIVQFPNRGAGLDDDEHDAMLTTRRTSLLILPLFPDTTWHRTLTSGFRHKVEIRRVRRGLTFFSHHRRSTLPPQHSPPFEANLADEAMFPGDCFSCFSDGARSMKTPAIKAPSMLSTPFILFPSSLIRFPLIHPLVKFPGSNGCTHQHSYSMPSYKQYIHNAFSL